MLRKRMRNPNQPSDSSSSSSSEEEASLPGELFEGLPDGDDEARPTCGVRNDDLVDVDVLDEPLGPLPKRWTSPEVSINEQEDAKKREVPKRDGRKGKRYARDPDDSDDSISDPGDNNPDKPMKIGTFRQVYLDWLRHETAGLEIFKSDWDLVAYGAIYMAHKFG